LQKEKLNSTLNPSFAEARKGKAQARRGFSFIYKKDLKQMQKTGKKYIKRSVPRLDKAHYECYLCDFKTRNFRDLPYHMDEVHSMKHFDDEHYPIIN
jgi:ribosomal protein L19E